MDETLFKPPATPTPATRSPLITGINERKKEEEPKPLLLANA